MSNCFNEAQEHGHSHGHHGHGHGHDHNHDHSSDITPAFQSLIYKEINFGRISTFNEDIEGSGRAIIEKRWADRLEVEPELESSIDSELFIKVPFTGQIKLHSILIRTSASDSAPKSVKLFKNSENIRELQAAQSKKCNQELELARTNELQEINVNRAGFTAVRELGLLFEDNFGDDEETTAISYLAFKGEFTAMSSEIPVVIYEAAARPTDHKTQLANKMSSQLGGT